MGSLAVTYTGRVASTGKYMGSLTSAAAVSFSYAVKHKKGIVKNLMVKRGTVNADSGDLMAALASAKKQGATLSTLRQATVAYLDSVERACATVPPPKKNYDLDYISSQLDIVRPQRKRQCYQSISF